MLHFAHTLAEVPLLGQGAVAPANALAYCVFKLDTRIPPEDVSNPLKPKENPRVA
jgi:hypothetical protein